MDRSLDNEGRLAATARPRPRGEAAVRLRGEGRWLATARKWGRTKGPLMSTADNAAARENRGLVQGRQPSKFTHENVARIKDWVAQGVGRDEIASRLGVTIGSLQVTCSRLGSSLRRKPLAKANGPIKPLGGIQRSLEHGRQSDHAARAKFTLLIQTQNGQAAFDLPLSRDLIQQLTLEASVRGQTTADLIGRIARQVMAQKLLEETLRNSPSKI